jgi:outer membrane lipoprotein-sorting protein
MIVLRKRAGALVAVSVVLLVLGACRSQNESLTSTDTQPSDTVVSSTPPFQTKEPERYSALRTITVVNAAGETLVTKTSVARDGDSRRNESTVASKTTILLDLPEGRFVLLAEEKVYADLTNEGRITADKAEDGFESSPDALLHTDAGSTSYQKMGAESVAGRNANKYRIVVNSSAAANVSQSETLMWIDETLQMPIRSETKSSDGTRVTMEVSEIKLEVDKGSFRIPEGYQKLTFAELRERLAAVQNNPATDKGIH